MEPFSKMIVANWKMNMTLKSSLEFIKKFIKNISNSSNEIVICPSFISLYAVSQKLLKTKIKVGAQNCFYKDSGAFTGEISPKMLLELGISYVIVGHSERRLYLGESSEIINKKLLEVLKNNLHPILCIGETKDQRNIGLTNQIITEELKKCLKGVSKDNIENVVIAYEPIWAIGSGKAIMVEEAEKICNHIREFLSQIYSENISNKIKILYGGSLNLKNFKTFLNSKSINGGLIGNASLDVSSFTEISNFHSLI